MSEETTRESTKDKKDVKAKQKPPLKLCYKQKIDLGRSDIVPFRPRSHVHFVTRKFYSPDYTTCSDEMYQNVKKEYENDPKNKYSYPVLESHRYGWYSDISFQDPDYQKDKRLHFKRSVSPLFSQPFFKMAL